MSGKTAIVEALTAEVRVLMVGSRQITLSVARQLDEVMPSMIKPFGRIRSNRNPGVNEIEVIGPNDIGELVRASIGYTWMTCQDDDSPQGYSGYNKRRLNSCGSCAVGDEKHKWPRYWGNCDGDKYSEWSDLPLIVLAGLR